MRPAQLIGIFILFSLIESIESRKHRHLHKPRKCHEPPTLKDELAEWLRESLEGAAAEQAMEDWQPPATESPICSLSPKGEGQSTVMQRALCPWDNRIDFDEAREPKILSEAFCLCRRSRGAGGAFCMPITREVAVLRRASCDPTTGYWQYIRSSQTVTVGCHSVLPRSQRATSLQKHYKRGGDEQV